MVLSMPGDLSLLIEKHVGAQGLALLRDVGGVAARLRMPLFLVGGSVRDLLLNQRPRDLDLVVEGDATALAVEAARELQGQVLSVSQFGTATLLLGRDRLDLATARKEVYLRPGALPTVSPSTISDDLRRRDFTINAMAIALSAESFGALVDVFGGQADLQQRLVRVLHARSFVDDATRILRAIRYEQRLSLRIENETSLLLGEALEAGMMDTISGDRLRHELHLMFQELDPARALLRAASMGVWRALYAPLDDVQGLRRLAGSGIKADEPLLYLAAMSSHLTREEADGFIARLNMPGRWSQVVRDTAALREIVPDLRRTRSIIQLCRLLDDISLAAVQVSALLAEDMDVRERLDRYLSEYRYVRPTLSGRDILALGVPEGPAVGRVLGYLREARLEGRAASRSDEIAIVRSLLADPTLTKAE